MGCETDLLKRGQLVQSEFRKRKKRKGKERKRKKKKKAIRVEVTYFQLARLVYLKWEEKKEKRKKR